MKNMGACSDRGTSTFILTILIGVVLFLSIPLLLSAKVTGVCSNCHTMHNSQDGADVTIPDTPANTVGWDSGGNISGGSADNTPAVNLLKSDCVGCHSSSTSSTKITIGTSVIPIVYNTVTPTTPLAGGNFYWIASESDDTKGHNVYGIAPADTTIVNSTAPGRNPGACANTCHDSLALAPSAYTFGRDGCQSCHVFTYHHDDNGVYRFLKGHGYPAPFQPQDVPARKDITSYTDYVQGVEDSDWEFTTNASGDHNYYKGTDDVYQSIGEGLTTKNTISAFCSGCHTKFHGPKVNGDGMGSASPWYRHPTDILLPDSDEYGQYDPDVNADYSVEAPVAWKNPAAPARGEAVVMCLSCHRAHGSPYADMLRWDYDGMIVGTTGSAADTGCFTCHRNKDGT